MLTGIYGRLADYNDCELEKALNAYIVVLATAKIVLDVALAALQYVALLSSREEWQNFKILTEVGKWM